MIPGLSRCDMGRRGMKRKKKDLNQHSWKVQYLTVSYRLVLHCGPGGGLPPE